MRLVDSSGASRTITGGWVRDATGWRPITSGAVRDGSTWRAIVGFAPRATASAVALDHVSARVTYEVLGATAVDVLVGGVLSTTVAGPSGAVTITGLTPGATVSISVRATVSGVVATSEPVSITTAGMPAPTGLAASSVTSSSYTLSWSSVLGATSYEVVNSATGSVLATVTGTSWVRTGLTSGAAYGVYLRARFSPSVVSGASSTLTTTTTAGFPAGVYTFDAASADTWSAGSAAWRNSTSDVWHGDGTVYGASGGTRTAFFFGYTRGGASIQSFFSGQGAVKVLKVEVYVTRRNTSHGVASAQTARFYQHAHATKPSTPATTGAAYNNGTLLRGESKWIGLPVSWGEALIAGTVRGIAWGGTPNDGGNRYMVGPNIASQASMMRLRITVG